MLWGKEDSGTGMVNLENGGAWEGAKCIGGKLSLEKKAKISKESASKGQRVKKPTLDGSRKE